MEEDIDPDSQYIPSRIQTHEFEPVVTEVKIWSSRNFVIALLIGMVFIAGIAILIIIFNLELVESLVIIIVTVVLYSMILFFLLGSKILRQIEKTTLHTVDRPVVKEVPVEVEKEVFIERPVIKEVIKEVPVEKKVYIQSPPIIKEVQRPVVIPVKEKKAKLNIPKYDFLGSTETKTYHKRNCRLSKLIKKKYKLSNNSEAYFKKKGFKACKVCIKKKK